MLARRSLILVLLWPIFLIGIARAQNVQPSASRPGSNPRTWSMFTEYSPGSSHIILGYSNQREFVTLGASFTQRLFQNRIWRLDYRAEIRPLMVESDPVLTGDYYNINLPPYDGYPGLQELGYYRQPHEMPVVSTASEIVRITPSRITARPTIRITLSPTGVGGLTSPVSALRASRRNFFPARKSSLC